MNFSVNKLAGAMVAPAGKTPSGTFDLSVIDRLPALRRKVQTMHVFRHGFEPSKVIKEALSKALVYYYPLAGRLVESGQGGLLQVACTGEGVWFVEASADCSLEAVDYLDDNPTSSFFQLLPDPPRVEDGVDPLVLMQVTQFTCDGFVIGLEFCHSICDGIGAARFLNAVAELARGHQYPIIDPVWHREMISAPPQHFHAPSPPPMPDYRLEQATIDIPLDYVHQLKREFFNLTGRTCSTFESLVADIWRYRTRSIGLDRDTDMSLVFFANARPLMDPPLPNGFYGNCFFPVTVTVTSGTLLQASNADVAKLIQEAKAKLPAQFAKWMRGDDLDGDMDPFTPPLLYTTLFVSEWGRLGFADVDYGWGPPVHIKPIQYSNVIPGCIMGSPPVPKKGIRLMTWCVERAHLGAFCDQLMIHS
ncbi:HXXXD-type acyl-transferase family protein [Tasmannia lanceolata]|uniref:HXXXD-type acyl-transferase family protein n=1 Tax=Tasmannia lanceolata TaxID=3420 RepID=UPI0040641873